MARAQQFRPQAPAGRLRAAALPGEPVQVPAFGLVEAEDAGTVKEISCEEGQAVNEGDTLVVLE